MNSGVHTNHADYEAALRAWLVNKWGQIQKNSDNLDDQLTDLHYELERLSTSIQKGLSANSIKGNTNVNDLFGVKSSADTATKIRAIEDLLKNYK